MSLVIVPSSLPFAGRHESVTKQLRTIGKFSLLNGRRQDIKLSEPRPHAPHKSPRTTKAIPEECLRMRLFSYDPG